MRFNIIWPAGILLFFLSACKAPAQTESESDKDIIPVRVQALATDSMQQQISVSGQFSTDDETLLSFKTGGVIRRIWVEEGDAVKKGQLLASLDLTEISAATSQSRIALEKAQRDFDRANNLYRDSVATLEQVQNARTALELARQQAASAGFNQQFSEIRAVSNGFVLRKFVNEGQVAAPGTPILQVNGAGDAAWLLKVGVSDRQWSQISEGTRATVTSDALPGESLEAVVVKKMEGLDPQTGTFAVHLQIKNPPRGKLAAGLFGKATIHPSSRQSGWAIPFDALLDGDEREAYVFVTNDDSTAQKVKVKVGRIDQNSVWIESGLENSKSLIISGSAYLNDGSRVEVVRGER
ncbi:MAG: efflux RND transporter periplasmic adaptor subunit [Chitinophagaceae bacterium]